MQRCMPIFFRVLAMPKAAGEHVRALQRVS